ncbi:MAG: hypothetical protein RBU28_09775, partial [Bacteroidales bacterium]|nr:hypothetical protein [Bacteroidales bacterium]
MKKGLRHILIIVLLLNAGNSITFSQILVESVAALAGNEVIYLSDIENMVNDLRRNGNKTAVAELRCSVLQDALISKLFLDQARIDSITVADDVVEGEVNMRINDVIRQAG